jgi:hypothetical protein
LVAIKSDASVIKICKKGEFMKILIFILSFISITANAGSKNICVTMEMENISTGEIKKAVSCSVLHDISTTILEKGSSRWVCKVDEQRKVGLFTQSDSGTDFFDLGDGVFRPIDFAKIKLSTTPEFQMGARFEKLGFFVFGLFDVPTFDLDPSVDHNRSINFYYVGKQLQLDSVNFAFSGMNGELYELHIKDAVNRACN